MGIRIVEVAMPEEDTGTIENYRGEEWGSLDELQTNGPTELRELWKLRKARESNEEAL